MDPSPGLKFTSFVYVHLFSAKLDEGYFEVEAFVWDYFFNMPEPFLLFDVYCDGKHIEWAYELPCPRELEVIYDKLDIVIDDMKPANKGHSC